MLKFLQLSQTANSIALFFFSLDIFPEIWSKPTFLWFKPIAVFPNVCRKGEQGVTIFFMAAFQISESCYLEPLNPLVFRLNLPTSFSFSLYSLFFNSFIFITCFCALSSSSTFFLNGGAQAWHSTPGMMHRNFSSLLMFLYASVGCTLWANYISHDISCVETCLMHLSLSPKGESGSSWDLQSPWKSKSISIK